MLDFVSPASGAPLQKEGRFLVSTTGERFPMIDEIPRFVSSDQYAASFGLQWTIYQRTQLDSHTGTPISRTRLERCLGKPLHELQGKLVFEAGCGAGRFTELLVDAGGLVHAVDLSIAVNANRENIGDRPNYRIAQADILAPPYPPESFDFVLCLGVLQHLPRPEDGMHSLWSLVKPDGLFVFDHYTWTLSSITKLSWLYRCILKRISMTRARAITDKLTELFFPLHWSVRNVYLAQMLLSRISPCLVYFRKYPELAKEQHYELCRLDTFDHLTDYYKHRRTASQIKRTLISFRAKNIWVARGDNGIEARATKPGDRTGPL